MRKIAPNMLALHRRVALSIECTWFVWFWLFFCSLVSCAKAPHQSVAVGAANDIRIERCARLTPAIARARAASNLFGFQTHDKVYGEAVHVIWATHQMQMDFAHYPARSNVPTFCQRRNNDCWQFNRNNEAPIARSARWSGFDMNENATISAHFMAEWQLPNIHSKIGPNFWCGYKR